MILGIPLCTRNVTDFWSWAHENNGNFTVRSAYKMLVNTKYSREGWLFHDAGSSNTVDSAKQWTNLWGSLIPSKLKVFLWRLAKHSIPTFDVLEHRNMADSACCPLCGAPDSWRHAFLDCSLARCVWALANETMVQKMTEVTDTHAKQWISAMQDLLSHVEYTEMVVTLWAVWYSRRKPVYEHDFQAPLETNHFIRRYILELGNIEHKLKPSQTAQNRILVKEPWVRPPQGICKFNVDGAVSKRGNRGTTAVVC